MARAEQLGENLSVLRQGARCAGAQGRGSLGGEAAGGRAYVCESVAPELVELAVPIVPLAWSATTTHGASPADQQHGRLVDDPQTRALTGTHARHSVPGTVRRSLVKQRSGAC